MLKDIEFHAGYHQGHIPCQDLCKMPVSRAHVYCDDTSPNLQRQRRCLMCSVTFASHCPSKHVSILLYFLIHGLDTHSSTVPKQDYPRLPQYRNICKVVLGARSWKSGNSCFTGTECCIFLQALNINRLSFIQVWIQRETSQIKVMYSLVDINVNRGTQFIMKNNLQNAFNPVIQYLYPVY